MNTNTRISRPRALLLLSVCMLISWWDFGIFTANGVFFDGFLEYYQSDRTAVAAVIGLFTACNQGFSFFSGLIINKFGFSTISLIGSLLTLTGLLLSVFAKSIHQILIYYGGITAIGISMLYMCSVTVLRQVCSGPYKKWLPISLTLHSMCISLAGLTYPFLISYLIDQYSPPGTFLILFGIVLNNICAIFLFYFSFFSPIGHLAKQNVTSGAKDVARGGTAFNDISPNAPPNDQLENPSSNNVVEIEMRPHNEQDIAKIDVLETENSPNSKINDNVTQNHTSKICSFVKQIQKISFPLVCIIVTVALGQGAETCYIAMIVDVFKSKGHSTERAILVFVPLNLCALVYRFLPGTLTKVNPFIFMTLYCSFGALGKFTLLCLTNYYSMLACASLSTAILGGLFTAVTIEIAGLIVKEQFQLTFGLIWTGIGLVTTIFSPALGAVRDASSNYDTVLAIIGGVQTACVISCILIWAMNKNTCSKCCRQ